MKIDLISVKCGIDVRDVRIQYTIETFKIFGSRSRRQTRYSKTAALVSTTRITYPLRFKQNLHGVSRELEAPVSAARRSSSNKSVSVASAKAPIVITAESHDLSAGVVELSEAINGTPIVSAASITFDLVFETGEKIPEIETVAHRSRQTPRCRGNRRHLDGSLPRHSTSSRPDGRLYQTGQRQLDSEQPI